MRIISIGEILWDVFPDGEHLGGAPFNFAVHARRLGEEVAFLSAVGSDERGREAKRRAVEFGLPAEFLVVVDEAATGEVRVSFDAAGQPQYAIVQPAAPDYLRIGEAMADHLRRFDADCVVFNTLFAHRPFCGEQLEKVLALSPRAKRFYDVNLRPASYDAAVVEQLLRAADVVKMNADESVEVASLLGWEYAGLPEFCSELAEAFALEAVCVTRGGEGCSVWRGGEWLEVEAAPVAVADTVGAGDAFAAGFLHAYARGWGMRETAEFANRLGGLVASRAGATPDWRPEEVGLYPRGDEI